MAITKEFHCTYDEATRSRIIGISVAVLMFFPAISMATCPKNTAEKITFAQFKSEMESCTTAGGETEKCVLQKLQRNDDKKDTVQWDASTGFFSSMFKKDNFYANYERYSYVELYDEDDADCKYQYQVGVGYAVAAKQKDFNLSANGMLSGVSVGFNPNESTAFIHAGIVGIGIKQAALSAAKGATPVLGTNPFDAIWFEPEITPKNFISAYVNLQSEFDGLYKTLVAGGEPAKGILVCPQIINRRMSPGEEPPKDEDRDAVFRRLSAKLVRSVCDATMPNAIFLVNFVNSAQSAKISPLEVEQGKNNILIEYKRRQTYNVMNPEDKVSLLRVSGSGAFINANSLIGGIVALSGNKSDLHSFSFSLNGENDALTSMEVVLPVLNDGSGQQTLSDLENIQSIFRNFSGNIKDTNKSLAQ